MSKSPGMVGVYESLAASFGPAWLERKVASLAAQLADVQSDLAAARKAQKNQRKANGKQADRAKA